jgi:hypothetical protein
MSGILVHVINNDYIKTNMNVYYFNGIISGVCDICVSFNAKNNDLDLSLNAGVTGKDFIWIENNCAIDIDNYFDNIYRSVIKVPINLKSKTIVKRLNNIRKSEKLINELYKDIVDKFHSGVIDIGMETATNYIVIYCYRESNKGNKYYMVLFKLNSIYYSYIIGPGHILGSIENEHDWYRLDT